MSHALDHDLGRMAASSTTGRTRHNRDNSIAMHMPRFIPGSKPLSLHNIGPHPAGDNQNGPYATAHIVRFDRRYGYVNDYAEVGPLPNP